MTSYDPLNPDPQPCASCGVVTGTFWGGLVPYCGMCDWVEFLQAARHYIARNSA